MDSSLISYGLEWLNLAVRWLHLIAGIAWIGASFYFVWLDNTIRPPAPGSELEKKGVSGELWAIHGGGFYHPQKYLVAPRELPEELHWFKWEAYVTWLSGFALLLIVYHLSPATMMIDKSIADLLPWQANTIGIGTLVVGWVVYDLLCRSPLGKQNALFGIVIYCLIVLVAFGLCHLISGRAAYIHVGAMLGTIMAANVLMVIIPGQKRMVAAMREGRSPDPTDGIRGKQRSVHNNYFTLPVLFIMISNHYAMTYTNACNWLVLAGLIASAVLFRHFFNLRHRGRTVWAYPIAAIFLMCLTAYAISPEKPLVKSAASANVATTNAVSLARIETIMAARCATCHAASPTQPGFASAPAGIFLDSPAAIEKNKEKIYIQAVQLKAMPLANLTKMTDEERAVLASWHQNPN